MPAPLPVHAFVCACVSVAVARRTGPAELVFFPSLLGDILGNNWGEYAHAVCVSRVGTEVSAHTVGICSLKPLTIKSKIFVSLVSCPS